MPRELGYVEWARARTGDSGAGRGGETAHRGREARLHSSVGVLARLPTDALA